MANSLLDEKEMSQSWRMSEILPFYKEKRYAKCCGSYRSVKLLEHRMKFLERIFEKWLRKQVEIDEMQMRYMPGKGTIDAIFLVKQMIDQYKVAGGQLFMVFVDLEKSI